MLVSRSKAALERRSPSASACSAFRRAVASRKVPTKTGRPPGSSTRDTDSSQTSRVPSLRTTSISRVRSRTSVAPFSSRPARWPSWRARCGSATRTSTLRPISASGSQPNTDSTAALASCTVPSASNVTTGSRIPARSARRRTSDESRVAEASPSRSGRLAVISCCSAGRTASLARIPRESGSPTVTPRRSLAEPGSLTSPWRLRRARGPLERRSVLRQRRPWLEVRERKDGKSEVVAFRRLSSRAPDRSPRTPRRWDL